MLGSPTVSLSNNQTPNGLGNSVQPFDNREPSLALNYLIAISGTFPFRSGGSPPDPTTPILGEVIAFAGNFVPSGWAPTNGQLLPINQNQALFSLLGTTYGGDGRTNFGLPDLRDHTVVGTGNGVAIGSNFGANATTVSADELPSTWAFGVNGDFAAASNWSNHSVPLTSDDAKITVSGTYTVTSSTNETVNSLTTSAAATLSITGGTFAINNGTDSGANAGTILVGAGATLTANGNVVNNGLIEALGGSIVLNGPTSGSGSFLIGNGGSLIATASSSNVFHGAGGSESVTVSGNLNQAFSDSGAGHFSFSGNQNHLIGGSTSDWLGVGGNSNAVSGGSGNDFLRASGR